MNQFYRNDFIHLPVSSVQILAMSEAERYALTTDAYVAHLKDNPLSEDDKAKGVTPDVMFETSDKKTFPLNGSIEAYLRT